MDGAGVVLGGQNFLGEVEGAVAALLKGQAGIVRQLCKGDGFAPGQRVPAPERHGSPAAAQGVKNEVILVEQLGQYGTVEVAEVEDAHLAFEGGHVADDLLRAGFADSELVP